MATEDRSRSAFYPQKHYAGVRMQQGRVLTDDDYNEGAQIEAEDQRATRVDVIGPHGSPDQGFLISDPRQDSGYIDFDIHPGTYYVGGLRLKLEPVSGEGPTFRRQSDWLLNPGFMAPAADENERFDLVYVEAWQQPVSAVEDQELFEVALGGPDTSTRLRTMARVKVETVVDPVNSCQAAGAQVVQRWIDAGMGRWDARNFELVSDTTLTVDYEPCEGDEDLCSPQRTAGYIGAENQTIRVQLIGNGNAFTWGFDNGAPLYRVEVVTTGGDALSDSRIRMLTAPKDHCHWPASGQVVEVLPCGAVLPNGERLAEELEPAGHLARVVSGYDPDTREFTIDSSLSDGFEVGWGETPGYLYLRVWDRGSDLTSDPAITLRDNPVSLVGTGVRIQVSEEHRRPGDYWIIAVRPETPDEVVPWELRSGRPPDGIRRFYAPLAVIHWHRVDGALVGETYDCRNTFRPLTDLKTCCTVTVGDGVLSHGDFNRIEDALRHVRLRGGEVCLLPGIHRTNAELQGAFNVRIKGCGLRTVVLPRSPELPLLSIVDSAEIALENLTLANIGITLDNGSDVDGGTAVMVRGTGPHRCGGIQVLDSRILAYRHAVRAERVAGLDVCRNVIRMWNRVGGDVAILASGRDVLVERNDIALFSWREAAATAEGAESEPLQECLPTEGFYFAGLLFYATLFQDVAVLSPDQISGALGGIQIGSGSRRIRILRNRIAGGVGHGITLGSELSLSDVGASEEESDTPDTINQVDRTLRIETLVNDVPKSCTVMFVSETGERILKTTNRMGRGDFELKPGRFRIFSTDPNLKLTSMIQRVEDGRLVIIIDVASRVLTPAQSTLAEALAPISEVMVAGNEIFRMGWSGIGIPWRSIGLEGGATTNTNSLAEGVSYQFPQTLELARLYAISGGLVFGLTISQNHIHECLQHDYDFMDTADHHLRRRGEGGISLGFCRNLVVRENRIESNGRDYRYPVCGVYVFCADQADISDNRILNNGPLETAPGAQGMKEGIRGGIVLNMATSIFAELLTGAASGEPLAAAAARGTGTRITGNTVKQSVGQALHVAAFGPIAVTDNRFMVVSSPPSGFGSDTGAVWIINYGLPHGLSAEQQWVRLFPSGNTLVSDNQITLGMARQCRAAVCIMTRDDLGFFANQCEILGEGRQVTPLNTLLLAVTLRAAQNRFEEPPETDTSYYDRLSLATISRHLNTTVYNQGDHCIWAETTKNGECLDGTTNTCYWPNRKQCSKVDWGKFIPDEILPPFLK